MSYKKEGKEGVKKKTTPTRRPSMAPDSLSTWEMDHEIWKLIVVRCFCCSLTCVIALVDFCKQKLDDPLR